MDSQQKLAKWLQGKWDCIAVQDGALEKSPTSQCYLLSGIWILKDQQWIEISSVEVHDTCQLACFVPNDIPIPESNRLFQPERRILSNCPKDCPLDRLVTEGVSSIKGNVREETNRGFILDSELKIYSKSNHGFCIRASQSFPSSIEIN